MRTTLDIDDDVLHAAKEIAANRRNAAGRVLSELAREALAPKQSLTVRNGVPLTPMPPKGTRKATMADVSRLRDDP